MAVAEKIKVAESNIYIIYKFNSLNMFEFTNFES